MSKKTNYSYVGISFIVLLFGIYFVPIIIDRITNKDVVRDESRSEDINLNPKKRPGNLSDLHFIELNGVRKKVPEFSFIDQDGKTISNKDYEGKVYVLEFFFTTCPSICPKMNANMLSIQNAFPNEKNFGIASFSITPDIDTPEVLKAYANAHGITHDNWHLMNWPTTAFTFTQPKMKMRMADLSIREISHSLIKMVLSDQDPIAKVVQSFIIMALFLKKKKLMKKGWRNKLAC